MGHPFLKARRRTARNAELQPSLFAAASSASLSSRRTFGRTTRTSTSWAMNGIRSSAIRTARSNIKSRNVQSGKRSPACRPSQPSGAGPIFFCPASRHFDTSRHSEQPNERNGIMSTKFPAARTYNQSHVPRKYTKGKRRGSIYWTWSYPWEAGRDPAALENRFSTMTEVRNVAWPFYETPEYSPAQYLQGI